MSKLVLLSIFAVSIAAQMFDLRRLEKYLELTPAQISKITAANNALDKWLMQTGERKGQLAAEIRAEFAKESPDAKALGVRYAEVEMIRRESESREAALLAQNTALLTEAQKTKLDALRALERLSADAVSSRLMAPSTDAVFKLCDPLLAHPSDSCFRLP